MSKIIQYNLEQHEKISEGSIRRSIFDTILHNIKKIDFGKTPTLIDVGCGPCIFAKMAHNAGYDVTALDGRTERVPEDIEFDFIESNLNDFDYAGYQVVVLLGVLYHLTLEDQVKFLDSIPDDSIFICDTQVHIPSFVQEHSWVDRHGALPSLVNYMGYEGINFQESNNPMASIKNTTSFWHTELSLSSLLDNTGFLGKFFINQPYVSKYGARRWFVASKSKKITTSLVKALEVEM